MATKANINIDQGTSFNTIISLTDESGNPLNLSAYTGQAKLRVSYASVNSTSFNVTLANGQIYLALDANTTSTLTRSRYIYDVILTDGSGNVTRVLEGTVYVDQAVTTPAVVPTYYTMYVANVQGGISTGDTVYQSNGSANLTGVVYETGGPQLLGYSYYSNAIALYANVTSNSMIVKIMNPSGAFTPTGNTSYILYDANTNANGIIMSVTQTVTPSYTE
jgi:hypothetical protein